jgi:hypothetical protein
VLILAALAVVEGLICAALVRGLRRAREGLRAARTAAEAAVRDAALAAPGAIDPEAVLALLREGHAPTLDNVYAMMRRHEEEEETAPAPESSSVPAVLPDPGSAAPASPP